MLWTNARRACVECGKLADAEDFAMHYGMRARGPAYWSDDGMLCSSVCALSHARRRKAEGRDMAAPAPAPGVGADARSR